MKRSSMTGHPAASAASYGARITVALRGSAGKRGGPRDRSRTAFTLVELMTAIGLIVVLAASLAMMFHREGNAGVALRSAGRDLGSALNLAQAMARARQAPVRLCLLTAPAADDAVGATGRRWWLVRAEGAAWFPLPEAGELPAGTCAVPAERSALRIRPGVVWPDGLLSLLDGPVSGDEGAVHYVEFRPDGSVSAGPRRIVLAAADEAPGQAPRLIDPAGVQIINIDGTGRIEKGEAR
jgi:type II secretory pathway pseudopilin PulG